MTKVIDDLKSGGGETYFFDLVNAPNDTGLPQARTGTGDLIAHGAQLTGAAVTHRAAIGALTISKPTLAGAGPRGVWDLGEAWSLNANGPTTAVGVAAKNAIQHVTGTGALTKGTPTIVATGVRHHPGTGALAAKVDLIVGIGHRGQTTIGPIDFVIGKTAVAGAGAVQSSQPQHVFASGALIATKVTLASAGIKGFKTFNNGLALAAKPTIVGAGVRHLHGTGVLNATQGCSVVGVGGHVAGGHIFGVGALIAQKAGLNITANTNRHHTAQGHLALQFSPVVIGQTVRHVSGTGVLATRRVRVRSPLGVSDGDESDPGPLRPATPARGRGMPRPLRSPYG